EEYVSDFDFTIDEEGFNKEMENQRARARAARQSSESMQVQSELFNNLNIESNFVGYDKLTNETELIAIIYDNEFINELNTNDEAYIILKDTPFYAESGGQKADTGLIMNDTFEAEVLDVQKAPKGQHLHHIKVLKGKVELNDNISANVNISSREGIIKNDTATHLLHQALKDVSGNHIQQAGSQVMEDNLRLDFTHFDGVTTAEIKEVERIVNEKIWADVPASIETMPHEEAKEEGAVALVGETFGDEGRVVEVGAYSLELCGRCHVYNTSEIRIFKNTCEAGIGASPRITEA